MTLNVEKTENGKTAVKKIFQEDLNIYIRDGWKVSNKKTEEKKVEEVKTEEVKTEPTFNYSKKNRKGF